MQPLVSIIIVNYNSGQFLTASVTAVLASTVSVNVWVIDNASQDTSLINLRLMNGNDARLNIIALDTNIGFAAANNLALRQINSEWLLLLNPDCIVQVDTLERMIAELINYPDVGMAGCLVCNPDGSEQAGCRRTLPSAWTGLSRALHLHRWLFRSKSFKKMDLLDNPLPSQSVFIEAISGAFMLLRQTALQQVGVMDEGYFLHCEDLDWCEMFRQAGWKILFVPYVKVVHYKGVCSNTRPLFVLWHKHRGMVRFYRKFLSYRYSQLFDLVVISGIWLRFVFMLPFTVAVSRWQTTPIFKKIPEIAINSKVLTLPTFTSLYNCRVLVTGGTGFIGRRLVAELLRQGAKVLVLSRFAPNPNLWPQEQVEWVRGDLTNALSLVGVCVGIDMVFHLASAASLVTKSVQPNFSGVVETGIDALLQEVERANVKRMIFISSVKAMGESSGEQCLDETSPELPLSFYGRAKLYSERLVLKTGQSTNVHVTILRLPMVYGPGNKGNLPRMMAAIRARTFPPLPQIHNRRSMVHVDDTVQAMLLAATGPQPSGRIYIVTDGEIYSTTDLERMIRIQLGQTLPRWAVPLWLLRFVAKLGDSMRVRNFVLQLNSEILYKLISSACYNNALIQQELGFKPRFTIPNSLLAMLAELDSP